MAKASTRQELIDYCLRQLGAPVLEVNVDDDQIDDLIDDAIQMFHERIFDGVEKMYLKYQITQADVDRAATNDTTNATDVRDGSVTTTFSEGRNFIPMPQAVVSVLNIFPFDDQATNNMFDIRYQLRLNDLYDFSSTSVIHYQMTMQHLDYLSHILVGEKPIRFNQHQNRLYIDMDFANDISVGEFIIIECYRKLDPDTYVDIYDDIYLKRYATALIKRQWGANLSKFSGVQLLGGVEMNGGEIYSQAQEELEKLEEQIQLAYELPPEYMMG